MRPPSSSLLAALNLSSGHHCSKRPGFPDLRPQQQTASVNIYYNYMELRSISKTSCEGLAYIPLNYPPGPPP